MTIYEFGAPLLTRASEIKEKCASSTTLFRLEVMGTYQPLKQIRVRIGMPVYRLQNGRTITLQKEYLATNHEASADLFTLDPDSLEAQKAQHSILQKLAEDEGLYKEFHDGTQQTEPIIVTCTGVVVNGNRRLCVWRTLFEKDPSKYKHFEYIDAAVLPEECDEADIRDLEKRLQIQKTHKAEYKWHSRAVMMKEERARGAGKDVLSKSFDVPPKDVETIISALEYAEIYLQKIGKPDQWSIVDGDEFAFRAFVEARKKIADQGKKELFETVCFKLIENGDYTGRLYEAIPKIAEHLEEVAAELQIKGVIPPIPSTDTTSDEIKPETDDDTELLGGEETTLDPYVAMANAIRSSDVTLSSLVRQVIDEQKSLEAEKKSSHYLVRTLAQVSKLLNQVIISGLNEGASTEGVNSQLDSVKEHINTIEKWLESK